MTTVASNQEGQSLLEFLIVLPIMLGLLALMTRVNTAIQTSLVDQQYARGQTLWLTFNSAVYPRLSLQATELNNKGYNMMTIGVSDNLMDASAGVTRPAATEANIARNPAVAARASDDNQVDGPQSRAKVRIRNTVTLCTQGNVVGKQPILPISNDGQTVTGPYNLSEQAKIDYCAGVLNE